MNATAPAPEFDVAAFLGARGQRSARFRKGAVLYSQATLATAVYYLKSGKIKIGVTSQQGKEAVVATVQPGSFLGEGCLLGQEDRAATAVAMVESEVLQVQKADMLRLLNTEPSFAQYFWKHLLLRNHHTEEDLADQIFDGSERRLARALLLLGNFGKEGKAQRITIRVSQETLADIIGTTPPRISHFMNKFRKLGYISYDGGLRVHNSLLAVLLHDGETPLPAA
jgi:CRP/FNR family cyclic AMP-dependent transcriptional regulator